MKRLLCMLLICLLAGPVLAETVQDQALAFIQEAGIAADSVMRMDDEIIVTLACGGTAKLRLPGDFDKYNLDWQFAGATDEDVGLYLDYALEMLAKIEVKIPADTSSLSTAESIRVRNYASVVANGLKALAQPDEQRIRVLQMQLALQDESGLDDLRTRLLEMIVALQAEESAE